MKDNGHKDDCNCLSCQINSLKAEVARLREGMEEFTLEPHGDSDPYSLLEWVRKRASALLAEKVDKA